jgi:hypothetical protein
MCSQLLFQILISVDESEMETGAVIRGGRLIIGFHHQTTVAYNIS